MQLQAHRGVCTEYPENTLPAFEAAIRQGYDIIEMDIDRTLDGQFVTLHDRTLNRTGRMADGSEIGEPVRLSDLTYEQALTYDMGRAFHLKFTGTKIPLLGDVLALAQKAGVMVKLDNAFWRFDDAQLAEFFALLRPFADILAFTCKDVQGIARVLQDFPQAVIHYDGPVSEESLREVGALVPHERLVVWLPYQNSRTTWVKVPFADEALAALVKRYGRLGLWLLSEPEELKRAEALGADVVETTGALKPVQNQGVVANMHTHSENSHDSQCPVEDMCREAARAGLPIMAVTDHCDMHMWRELDLLGNAQASSRDADAADGKFGLRVLRGIEIGEMTWAPDEARRILAGLDLDVRIGSVHCVRWRDRNEPYSDIDFSAWSDEDLVSYMDAYLDEIIEMMQTMDFDIMAHLLNPLRYIEGKCGRPVDLTSLKEKIDQVLRYLIAHGIALEVNTCNVRLPYGTILPKRDVLERYQELGGKLITLGSDAHIAERCGWGIPETVQLLRDMGFAYILTYDKRVGIPCTL